MNEAKQSLTIAQNELKTHEQQLKTAEQLLKKYARETKAENNRKRAWQIIAVAAVIAAAVK